MGHGLFWGDGATVGRLGPWNHGDGWLWGDGSVGRPMRMDLWGIERFGVMEPLWGDGRHGMVGLAGCGVMELWGVP